MRRTEILQIIGAYISVLCTFCVYCIIYATNINGALHLKMLASLLPKQNIIEPFYFINSFSKVMNNLLNTGKSIEIFTFIKKALQIYARLSYQDISYCEKLTITFVFAIVAKADFTFKSFFDQFIDLVT